VQQAVGVVQTRCDDAMCNMFKQTLSLSNASLHSEQQLLYGHACALTASNQPAQKNLYLVDGTEKLRSKFGEDRS